MRIRSWRAAGTLAVAVGLLAAGWPGRAAVAQAAGRVAGATREGTAMAVAEAEYPEGPPSGLAIVTSGQNANLVDALTAAPLARALGAPILLADGPQDLGRETASDLVTLHIRRVILVGAAANATLKAQLPPGVTVQEELAGPTRFGTAADVAGALAAAEGVSTFPAVMVASGEPGHLVDALAADPAAARLGIPILLAPSSGWPGMVNGERMWLGTTGAVYAIGAAASYPFTGLDRPPLAVAGSDRFRTALAVDRVFAPLNGSYRQIFVANGQGAHLVDALAAGPWAAAEKAGLVLVDGGTVPASTAAFLAGEAGEIGQVRVLGGTASIPAATGAAVDQALSLSAPAPGLTVAFGGFTSPDGTALTDLRAHPGQVAVAAPLWYRLGGSKAAPALEPLLPASRQQGLVTDLHAQGLRVWPVVQYTAGSGLIEPLAGNPAVVSTLASAMQSAVAGSGADGLVLDLEGLPPADRAGLNALVQAVARALHGDGKQLMVTVGPQPYPQSAYDDAALAGEADYLDLLAYPEYTPSSPSPKAPDPGPTQGLPFTQAALEAALAAGVPASHLILGLAAYGQTWTYTRAGFGGGEALGAGELALHRLPQSAGLWDPAQGELTFTAGAAAVAPGPLAPGNSFSPAVQDLQALLNTILLWHARATGTPAPALLATDGGYGPATGAAVRAFQAAFDPTAANPGVYGPGTARALTAVVQELGIRQQVVWDADARAGLGLMRLAAEKGLGGVSLWELGLESPGYWQGLKAVFGTGS